MKRLLIYTLLIILPLSACKKRFEEDPRASIKKPEKRMEGTWLLQDYQFNGSSIVGKLNSMFNNRFDVLTTRLGYLYDKQGSLSVKNLSVPFGDGQCGFGNDQIYFS